MLTRVIKKPGVLSERKTFWRVEYFDGKDGGWHYFTECLFKFIAKMNAKWLSGIKSSDEAWNIYRKKRSGEIQYYNNKRH
jgi:hypothetical protein